MDMVSSLSIFSLVNEFATVWERFPNLFIGATWGVTHGDTWSRGLSHDREMTRPSGSPQTCWSCFGLPHGEWHMGVTHGDTWGVTHGDTWSHGTRSCQVRWLGRFGSPSHCYRGISNIDSNQKTLKCTSIATKKKFSAKISLSGLSLLIRL